MQLLLQKGQYIFAGGSALYRTSDRGLTWTQVNNQPVYAIAASGTYLFEGRSDGVYLSADDGVTWVQKNEGLPGNPSIETLYINNNYIYAGTSQYDAWKRPVPDLVGVANNNTSIPQTYSLHQNYPNPFNPNTVIGYDLPKAGFVKLTVFDLLGREVAVLVNQRQNAGSFKAAWDGSNNSSGVYYYKLTSGNFTQTNKMILVK